MASHPKYLQEMIQSFTPNWARSIAYSLAWEADLKSSLELGYIELVPWDSLIKNSANKQQSCDALYLSSSELPQKAADFIYLFQRLNKGAVLVMELGAKQWKRMELIRISESMGASLLFFAPVRTESKNAKGRKKIAVIQKGTMEKIQKRLTILIPVLSAAKSHPRVLQWLQYLHEAELTPYVELLLVFDGVHDLLPAWPEYEYLEKENGFQMLRHYRSFGKAACLRTGLMFFRGQYLLWDHAAFVCSEALSLLDCIFASSSNDTAFAIHAKLLHSHKQSGKLLAFPMASSVICLNRMAACALYERPYECQKLMSTFTYKNLRSLLKKARIKTAYAYISSA